MGTLKPTKEPTSIPTIVPSENSSTSPSLFPTDNPSIDPTSQSSKYPSVLLSSVPTVFPSIHPSIISTNNPTNRPIIVAKQSDKPTISPTNIPTTTTLQNIFKADSPKSEEDKMFVAFLLVGGSILLCCLCLLLLLIRFHMSGKHLKPIDDASHSYNPKTDSVVLQAVHSVSSAHVHTNGEFIDDQLDQSNSSSLSIIKERTGTDGYCDDHDS